jgi:uncharacterized membrane-anchored protein YhcB (DUF1043 family)
MNEVTVTVLPHPVTMFFLGGMLLGLIMLYFEFRRVKDEAKDAQHQLESLKKDLEQNQVQTQKSIHEVSRKVDSRIDKALGTIKN